MCITQIFNMLQSAIRTQIEINAMMYRNDVTITEMEQISKLSGGTCMFRNRNGNCKSKNTYFIHSIGKCVCYLHMTEQQNRVHKIINFHKSFNFLVKKLFHNMNNKEKYIELLKDILLLITTHKKYKYTLHTYFNIVDSYVDNFEIDDDEFNALLDHYKYSN